MAPEVKGVLFDLDGTLADTAGDMAGVLNAMLVERGKPPLAVTDMRNHVSQGSAALLHLGFGVTAHDDGFTTLRDDFLNRYRDNLCNATVLFAGVAKVLDALDAKKIPWGIVTNKPGFLTEPLLAALQIKRRCACIISGDTFAERKPHPMPIQQACAALGCAPGEVVYVGDAHGDVKAAHAAGARALVALYGYIDPARHNPDEWRADGYVRTPDELPGLLFGNNARPPG